MTLWWGEPWPSDKLRAPVCEDDALRVRRPVGHDCDLCGEPIIEGDRGVSMWGLDADGDAVPVNHHIECNMRNVMGCYELVSTGAVWTPDHVCTGRDNYREDALKVWAWVQSHPVG